MCLYLLSDGLKWTGCCWVSLLPPLNPLFFLLLWFPSSFLCVLIYSFLPVSFLRLILSSSLFSSSLVCHASFLPLSFFPSFSSFLPLIFVCCNRVSYFHSLLVVFSFLPLFLSLSVFFLSSSLTFTPISFPGFSSFSFL